MDEILRLRLRMTGGEAQNDRGEAQNDTKEEGDGMAGSEVETLCRQCHMKCP